MLWHPPNIAIKIRKMRDEACFSQTAETGYARPLLLLRVFCVPQQSCEGFQSTPQQTADNRLTSWHGYYSDSEAVSSRGSGQKPADLGQKSKNSEPRRDAGATTADAIPGVGRGEQGEARNRNQRPERRTSSQASSSTAQNLVSKFIFEC